MTIEELQELIEKVGKDKLPLNVFTIEDEDPYVILGKMLAVEKTLKEYNDIANLNIESTKQAINKADEAIETANRAVSGIGSNPNLLINGDFRVNQRGQTSYTAPTNSNKTYCVDRFYLNWATALTNINNNSITLQFNRQYAVLGQVVEDFNKYKGKTLTLSVKVSNVSTPQNLYLRIDEGVSQQSVLINGNGIFTKTITLSDNATQLACTIFNTNATGTTITLDVEYMKLEIGSVATPFNPRPYAEELAICQRYYRKYTALANSTGTIIGTFFSANANAGYTFIDYGISMRKAPTIKYPNLTDILVSLSTSNTYLNFNSFGFADIADYQKEMFYCTGNFEAGKTYMVRIAGGSYFEADAELY